MCNRRIKLYFAGKVSGLRCIVVIKTTCDTGEGASARGNGRFNFTTPVEAITMDSWCLLSRETVDANTSR